MTSRRLHRNKKKYGRFFFFFFNFVWCQVQFLLVKNEAIPSEPVWVFFKEISGYTYFLNKVNSNKIKIPLVSN